MLPSPSPDYADSDSSGGYYFPPYITRASIEHAPARSEYASALLGQYHLHYTVSGTVRCEIDGDAYTAYPGDLILRKPETAFAVQSGNQEPMIHMLIVFHFGSSYFPMSDFIETGYLGNCANTPIEKQLHRLAMAYGEPGIAGKLLCQQQLLQLLCELHNHASEAAGEPRTNRKIASKMILIRNYLVDHYHEKIAMKDLEALSGLSRNYIIIQFKSMFQMQPMQYLIWLRIEKAKELAMRTDLSFGEIAARVGYSDLHAFSRIFKRKTGCSLSQFCASLSTVRELSSDRG